MRPAWYSLRGGGWRDYVTLLHPPYTLWHLSYVVIGGLLARDPHWGRLLLTLIAFFLAMGIAAHALDELNGRPLRTAIPTRVLAGLAGVGLAGACAIGVLVAVEYRLWLLGFVAVGAFLVPAYNLEWFAGRFHTALWFGLAWGAFPVLTAAAATTGAIRIEAALAAVAAVLLSLAQRRLSTAARHLRRDVAAVRGTVELHDGTMQPLTAETLAAPPEAALRLLSLALPLLAVALVAERL